jgi:hypothetical protein
VKEGGGVSVLAVLVATVPAPHVHTRAPTLAPPLLPALAVTALKLVAVKLKGLTVSHCAIGRQIVL